MGGDTSKANEKNLYPTYSALLSALHAEGLESSRVIIGFDFSSSNDTSGFQSYRHCMHDVNSLPETPYEKVAKSMAFLIKEFDESGIVPCYVFGDSRTRDQKVVPLAFEAQNANIQGINNVVAEYRKACTKIAMHGPTTMAPMIKEAIKLCQEKRQFHILVIITDGGISDPKLDGKMVIEASNYPLSIITVGVGDGPFDILDQFDNNLRRKFDNFNFFNYTEMEAKLGKIENVEEAIAVEMLQELPTQFKAIKKLGLL